MATQRGNWRRMVLFFIAWGLFTTQGLCGDAPEPLQNRSNTEEPRPESTTPGSNTVVVPQGGGVTYGGNGGTIVVPGAGGTVVTPVPGSATGAAQDGQGRSVVVPGANTDTVIPVPGGAVVPVEPGKGLSPAPGTTVPVDKDKVVPGKTVPADKTTVVPVQPGATTPLENKGVAVPGKTVPGAPETGKTIEVAPDAVVRDDAKRPVPLTPGQEVVLPKGGTVTDSQGRQIPVPPGTAVLVPARPMTPGDFLPKTGKTPDPQQPEKNQPEKTPAQKVAPGPAGAKKTPPAKEKPQVAPEAKKQPEKQPEKPEIPQAAAKPRSGDPFKIDADACSKHTVDFLKGCWRGVVTMTDRTDVVIRLCFDENGNGKRIDKYQRDGKECVGATRGSWTGEQLSFSFTSLHCTDGHSGTDMPIVCQGCGENTQCVGTEYKTGTGKITGKTNFHITRE